MPRRKAGTLLPLEKDILDVAIAMGRAGVREFHGFGIADALRDGGAGSRSLTAHGTLYKALGRLEDLGLLASRWEDEPVTGRPRRRLYSLTGQGIEAAATRTVAPATTPTSGVAGATA
jgi:DNA-binding PadR family transcriptional regulator